MAQVTVISFFLVVGGLILVWIFGIWKWNAEIVLSWVITVLWSILLITGRSFGRSAQFAIGVVFLIGGIIMAWIFGVWKWNADKFGAYRIARGKQLEALALWKDVGERDAYLAKDRFYETQYGGKVLRVLRDGTMKIEGTYHNVQGGDVMESVLKSSVGGGGGDRGGGEIQVNVAPVEVGM